MGLFARSLRELGDAGRRAASQAFARSRRRSEALATELAALADLVRRLALRRRGASRSSSAPRSPPPTSRSPGSRDGRDLDRADAVRRQPRPPRAAPRRRPGVRRGPRARASTPGALLEHDSPEEVEIRACALHAVELLVRAHGDHDRDRRRQRALEPRRRSRATRRSPATARGRRPTSATCPRSSGVERLNTQNQVRRRADKRSSRASGSAC